MPEGKRVFKVKTFDRWAKGVLTDKELCKAAKEVIAGQFEADLGGGVCKKRVAVKGMGKSGATRTLIAKENALGIFFVTGRQKSDPGTDFTPKQEAVAKVIAKGLSKVDESKLTEMLADGSIKEICNAPEEEGDEQPGDPAIE